MDTIYLDTCALNRLTDDLSQPRIRAEAEAVARILESVFAGQLRWIASTVLQQEIQRNPDRIRRIGTLRVLSQAEELITPTEQSVRRALSYTHEGLGRADALHLAVSEQANVDVLITTDDAFLKTCTNTPAHPSPRTPQSSRLAQTEATVAAPQSVLASNLSSEEFERRTLDAIQREFGPSDLVRFLMEFRSGHGDYTAERHQWLDSVTLEDLAQDPAVDTRPQAGTSSATPPK